MLLEWEESGGIAREWTDGLPAIRLQCSSCGAIDGVDGLAGGVIPTRLLPTPLVSFFVFLWQGGVYG